MSTKKWDILIDKTHKDLKEKLQHDLQLGDKLSAKSNQQLSKKTNSKTAG